MDEKDKRILELERQLNEVEDLAAARMLGALQELALGVGVPHMQAYVLMPDIPGEPFRPMHERIKLFALQTHHVEGWFRALRDKFEDARSWNLLDMARHEASTAQAREHSTMQLYERQRQALANCTKAMLEWGAEEDGIPEEFYSFYEEACTLLGVTHKNTGYHGPGGEPTYRVVWPLDVQPYSQNERTFRDENRSLRRALAGYVPYTDHASDCVKTPGLPCSCGLEIVTMTHGRLAEKVRQEIKEGHE